MFVENFELISVQPLATKQNMSMPRDHSTNESQTFFLFPVGNQFGPAAETYNGHLEFFFKLFW